jgi:hypothetical protein
MSPISLVSNAAALICSAAITFDACARPAWPESTLTSRPSWSDRAGAAGSTTLAASCANVVNPAERRIILDSVRGTVERALGAPIEFRVTTIRVCGGWAFMIAEPQRPGGGTIQWNRTVCRGDTSHLVGALSQRDASGIWRLVENALCPSDVAWADWPAKYGVPEQILGF